MTLSIKRIFISNRGEICRRVALAAEKLSIESVSLVDPAVPTDYLRSVLTKSIDVIGLSSAHYLDMDQLIKTAKDAGCDAVHPGYGYLSENSTFAKKVVEAGLIWIGPHSQSMDKMASKAVARDIAEANEVPCLKALKFSSAEEIKEKEKELLDFVREIGLPVLMKASMGGGGKGMRIVREEKDLYTAAERASSEAISAFGDGEIIVEKYIERPRHVEVQLICDKHGHYFAIGDRDCSAQRRHQKVVEEAPAPELTQLTRDKLHSAACRLAEAVGYDSAGTVEFLVDWSEGQKDLDEQSFYFLEMNTRLQVEHPVTEECYGIDLVEWQIKVADSQSLPEKFRKMEPTGHVVELRIYAEDPNQDYLPSPGPVDLFLPDRSLSCRWDIGLDPVAKVSPQFDPMITKLIVKSYDRRSALILARDVLKRSVISGTKTNVPFVMAICADPEFQAGAVSTKYLEERIDFLKASQMAERDSQERRVERLRNYLVSHPEVWLKNDKIMNNSEVLTANIFVDAHTKSESSDIMIADRKILKASGGDVEYGIIQVGPEEKLTYYRRDYPGFQRLGLVLNGESYHFETYKSDLDKFAEDDIDEASVLSPVPGKVVSVRFKEGDVVEKNDVVVIIESMKMEFEVKTPDKRTIDKLLVSSGDQVESGTTLVTWQE